MFRGRSYRNAVLACLPKIVRTFKVSAPLTSLFAVPSMMYGFGDSDQPLPETVELIEVRLLHSTTLRP